jgi:hypothetical protein
VEKGLFDDSDGGGDASLMLFPTADSEIALTNADFAVI